MTDSSIKVRGPGERTLRTCGAPPPIACTELQQDLGECHYESGGFSQCAHESWIGIMTEAACRGTACATWNRHAESGFWGPFAPVLTSVEGTFRVAGDAALQSLALAELTLTGQFTVDSNAKLAALNLPLLESVSGDFSVTDNPALPTCQVTALENQLQTLDGLTTISGNDDVATCP